MAGCATQSKSSMPYPVAPAKALIDQRFFSQKLLEQDEVFYVELLSRASQELPREEESVFLSRHGAELNALLINDYIQYKLAQNPVTVDEIAAYYKQHKKRFQIPDKYELVLVFARQRKDAFALLDAVKEGGDFELLAKDNKNLEVPFSGWMEKSKLPKAISKTVLQLETGQSSGLLQVDSGYYVVKLKSKLIGHVQPLKDVAGTIRDEMTRQRLEEMLTGTP